VKDKTVDATLANGTFVVRILYPLGPDGHADYDGGVVRAYDATGRLLGEFFDRDGPCYVTEEGACIGPGRPENSDHTKCLPAVPWE
jgi:hypothetical protein